jgi:hypothetical protein
MVTPTLKALATKTDIMTTACSHRYLAERLARPPVPAEPIPLPTWVNRTLDTTVFTQPNRYTTKHQRTSCHVALVFHKRRLIAIGQNLLGGRNMIHAEADVIRKVGDLSKLRGAVLVVIRIGRTGDIRYSAPCHACQCLIDKCKREYGLRECIHS